MLKFILRLPDFSLFVDSSVQKILLQLFNFISISSMKDQEMFALKSVEMNEIAGTLLMLIKIHGLIKTF